MMLPRHVSCMPASGIVLLGVHRQDKTAFLINRMKRKDIRIIHNYGFLRRRISFVKGHMYAACWCG